MRAFARTLLLAGVIPVASAQSSDELRRWLDDGRKVADQFVLQLSGELRRELELSGPMRGLIVCKYGAPEIASSLSRRTGWRVSRVSLQTRNPALGLPDSWEYRVLRDFDQRQARGEKAESLEFGNYFRYMKALPVTRVCLTCHGPQEGLSAEVRERLALDYPHDRGTGYTLGQVRGAVTVKRPL
jgi:Protein of unknown function (DUF3365)